MSWRQQNAEWEQVLRQLPPGPALPCPYYAGRASRCREFAWDADIPPPLFARALEVGYRRCGNVYYQPACADCHACTAYRLAVAHFRPDRSMRRTLHRNADVVSRFGPPRLTAAKAALYLRYQRCRHPEPRPADPAGKPSSDALTLLRQMGFQMYCHPTDTVEQELWLGERLLGFSILDVAPPHVSAVYSVFEPTEPARGLGTLAILRAIAWTREQGHAYFHLGFHLAGHPKMDYKARFQPAEVLDAASGQWRPYPAPA